MTELLGHRLQSVLFCTRITVQHQNEIGELAELSERPDVAGELVPPGVPADDDVLVAHTRIDVQYIQHAADHAFGDLVFAQYGEPVLRLPVQRFLEDVAVERLTPNLSSLLIAVQEYPPFPRHAVQNDEAVRGDDNLQLLPQGTTLQFEHRLLLGIGMQPRVHLVDEDQCVFEMGDIL